MYRDSIITKNGNIVIHLSYFLSYFIYFLSTTDKDECADRRDNDCQMKCINNYGGYSCECHHGFRLNSDNKTCSGK